MIFLQCPCCGKKSDLKKKIKEKIKERKDQIYSLSAPKKDGAAKS
jgi:hypothetical protein